MALEQGESWCSARLSALSNTILNHPPPTRQAVIAGVRPRRNSAIRYPFEGSTVQKVSALAYHARTARGPRREPVRRDTKPQREKDERLGIAPYLSAREIRALRERAAADLRTLANYVSYLVCESLSKPEVSNPAGVDPREKRKPFTVKLDLTAAERKQLEARAKAERRSLSGCVFRSIVNT